MSAVRQDAWSDDDDLILAEVTLRHIREGGTQLSAFEEVGERIGRTSAACGFRWNSYVRKKYEPAIQIAKAQRQKRNQLKRQTASSLQGLTGMVEVSAMEIADLKMPRNDRMERNDAITEELISIDAVIRFLRQWKVTYQEMTRHTRSLEKELHETQEQLDRIKKENDKLNKQYNVVETDYRVVNDDYRALIQIMDRARKLAFLVEEDEENKSRFKMDANGNLERIES
ncbi:MAG: precorrin-3B C17-methyltransferase [Bacilli bacterium]|nr:precorrin-3B C17-methyltransferase [Bacilli bacterium]